MGTLNNTETANLAIVNMGKLAGDLVRRLIEEKHLYQFVQLDVQPALDEAHAECGAAYVNNYQYWRKQINECPKFIPSEAQLFSGTNHSAIITATFAAGKKHSIPSGLQMLRPR
jgi:hypothetical protein